MPETPSRRDVADFLARCKIALDFQHKQWADRKRTTQDLIDLGITQRQAEDYVLSLTPDNYSEGPMQDSDHPARRVWVFGVEVAGVETYVKLALAQHPRKRSVEYVLIWSFHKAEHAMRYPLRGEK